MADIRFDFFVFIFNALQLFNSTPKYAFHYIHNTHITHITYTSALVSSCLIVNLLPFISHRRTLIVPYHINNLLTHINNLLTYSDRSMWFVTTFGSGTLW